MNKSFEKFGENIAKAAQAAKDMAAPITSSEVIEQSTPSTLKRVGFGLLGAVVLGGVGYLAYKRFGGGAEAPLLDSVTDVVTE